MTIGLDQVKRILLLKQIKFISFSISPAWHKFKEKQSYIICDVNVRQTNNILCSSENYFSSNTFVSATQTNKNNVVFKSFISSINKWLNKNFQYIYNNNSTHFIHKQ